MHRLSLSARLLPWLLAAGGAQAGVFHRCDDGSGVAIYQNQPCAAGHATLATQRFEEPAPPRAGAGRAARGKGASTSRPARGGRGGSTRAPRSAAPRESAETAAYACSGTGTQWLQATPCAAGGRTRARQQALSRDELCQRIRSGDTGAAPGENTAGGGYRRNLLRARGRC